MKQVIFHEKPSSKIIQLYDTFSNLLALKKLLAAILMLQMSSFNKKIYHTNTSCCKVGIKGFFQHQKQQGFKKIK